MVTPTYTNADLIAKVASLSCCSASLAYSIVKDMNQGVESCDCKWDELYYLTSTKKMLESTIDIYQNPNVRATATITIPVGAFNLTATSLSINGVVIYTHAPNFATIGEMMFNVAGTYGGVVIVWNGVRTLTFTAPVGSYYNGISVHLEYFDNGFFKGTVQFNTQFAGGQVVQSYPPICVTNEIIESVFENIASVCGCSACVNINDNL